MSSLCTQPAAQVAASSGRLQAQRRPALRHRPALPSVIRPVPRGLGSRDRRPGQLCVVSVATPQSTPAPAPPTPSPTVGGIFHWLSDEWKEADRKNLRTVGTCLHIFRHLLAVASDWLGRGLPLRHACTHCCGSGGLGPAFPAFYHAPPKASPTRPHDTHATAMTNHPTCPHPSPTIQLTAGLRFRRVEAPPQLRTLLAPHVPPPRLPYCEPPRLPPRHACVWLTARHFWRPQAHWLTVCQPLELLRC